MLSGTLIGAPDTSSAHGEIATSMSASQQRRVVMSAAWRSAVAGPFVEVSTGMRWVLLALLVIGCATNDGSDPPANPDPALCPGDPFVVCGYRDGGWELYCDGGIIYEQSFNGAMYCAPPSSEVVCEDVDPTPRAKSQCTSGCKNGEHKYLETIGEYSAFDPMTLCLP